VTHTEAFNHRKSVCTPLPTIKYESIRESHTLQSKCTGRDNEHFFTVEFVEESLVDLSAVWNGVERGVGDDDAHALEVHI